MATKKVNTELKVVPAVSLEEGEADPQAVEEAARRSIALEATYESAALLTLLLDYEPDDENDNQYIRRLLARRLARLNSVLMEVVGLVAHETGACELEELQQMYDAKAA